MVFKKGGEIKYYRTVSGQRRYNVDDVPSKCTPSVAENQGYGIVALDHPGSKVIRSGEIKLDRDLNGARNIFIRSLVDSLSQMKLISSESVINVC